MTENMNTYQNSGTSLGNEFEPCPQNEMLVCKNRKQIIRTFDNLSFQLIWKFPHPLLPL